MDGRGRRQPERLPPHYAPVTVPELLRARAESDPSHLAVVAALGGRHYALDREALDRHSDAVARGIVDRWQLPGGTCIGWALDNDDALAAVVLFHAVLKAGLVNVPINTRLTPTETGELLAHSACQAFLLGPRSSLTADVLGLDERAVVRADADPNVAGLGALYRPGDVPYDPRPPDRDALASILYTSGTTGLPKGVEHTHESSIAAAISWADALGLTSTDVLQSPFPVFSGAGLHFNALSSLWAGGAVVVSTADTSSNWRLIEQWRSTLVVAVPSIYRYWLDNPELSTADLSSVRVLDYGGASMPREMITALRERLPAVRLVQTYGLTEAGPGGTYLPAEHALDRPESIGSRAAGPFTRVRVIREDGTDVDADEPGELVLRGPSVMRGYHEDAGATAAVFADGWLRSGDIVRYDADGFLYLVDRRKDLIIRGGHNISSLEIESAVLSDLRVGEAAAFGLPHPRLGESVAVAVVAAPGQVISADEVRRVAARTLADFKVPRDVFVVAELPRNAAGKVHKRKLAERYARR